MSTRFGDALSEAREGYSVNVVIIAIGRGPPAKGFLVGPFLPADRGAVNEPLFDKMAGRPFWARSGAKRYEGRQPEDENAPKRNPFLSATLRCAAVEGALRSSSERRRAVIGFAQFKVASRSSPCPSVINRW